MWKYVLEIMIKSDNREIIIAKLKQIVKDLESGSNGREFTCSEEVDFEWDLSE